MVNKMKIALLGCLNKNKSGNVYGGAEKSLINLANWLSRNENNEVLIVSVEGNVCAYPLDKKEAFIGYGIKAENKILLHIQMYKNTVKAIKKIQPDIVIGFWIHPLFYMILGGVAKKIPMIYSERNDPELDYGTVAKYMRNKMMKRAKGIVFQTSGAKKYFREDIQKKSRVIHNPVYMKYEKYPVYDDGRNRIVTVGRLNKQKNHKVLIEAFKKISAQFPMYTLEIYGEGPLKEDLKKQIAGLNLETKVFLKGAYSDVLERIYGAELFVLPSLYEGMPNALLEAMSMGIVVLSTNCPCGGPSELIQHGKNGFLCNTDDIEDLKDKIELILNMGKNEKKEIQDCAKEVCCTHSEEIIFGKWNDYIEECINYVSN